MHGQLATSHTWGTLQITRITTRLPWSQNWGFLAVARLSNLASLTPCPRRLGKRSTLRFRAWSGLTLLRGKIYQMRIPATLPCCSSRPLGWFEFEGHSKGAFCGRAFSQYGGEQTLEHAGVFVSQLFWFWSWRGQGRRAFGRGTFPGTPLSFTARISYSKFGSRGGEK